MAAKVGNSPVTNIVNVAEDESDKQEKKGKLVSSRNVFKKKKLVAATLTPFVTDKVT